MIEFFIRLSVLSSIYGPNGVFLVSETMLLDNECPQDFIIAGKHTMLAYKRIDAKIAWPNQDKLNI